MLASSSPLMLRAALGGDLKSRSYFPSMKNSEAATSIPITTLSVKPAFSMAVLISSRAEAETQDWVRQHLRLWGEEPGACFCVVVVPTFTVLLYVWGKPALVSHICSILAVLLLDHVPQSLVELGPDTQSITERLGPYRKNHELLHGQSVPSMGAPVDHIKCLKVGPIRKENQFAYDVWKNLCTK